MIGNFPRQEFSPSKFGRGGALRPWEQSDASPSGWMGICGVKNGSGAWQKPHAWQLDACIMQSIAGWGLKASKGNQSTQQ